MKTSQQLVAEAKEHINELSIDDLDMIMAKEKEAAVLIDVREPAEYQAVRAPFAINLPRGILEFQLSSLPHVASASCAPEVALEQLREQPIYLICRSGGRSALAALSLQKMGFSQVYSIAGGMNAWTEAQKSVISS